MKVSLALYTENLPSAVSRDFEFETVLKAEGEAQPHFMATSYKSPEDIPDSAYTSELEGKAINVAKSHLLDEATKYNEKLSPEDLPIAIVADVRVIRKFNAHTLSSDNRYIVQIQVFLEAIAYKRRNANC